MGGQTHSFPRILPGGFHTWPLSQHLHEPLIWDLSHRRLTSGFRKFTLPAHIVAEVVVTIPESSAQNLAVHWDGSRCPDQGEGRGGVSTRSQRSLALQPSATSEATNPAKSPFCFSEQQGNHCSRLSSH